MTQSSEAEIVAAIAHAFAGACAPGAHGLVDDTATLPATSAGSVRVVTTDVVVEGVDFRAEDDEQIATAGGRTLVQNISDLNAAGAGPVGFVWSLAIPRGFLDDGSLAPFLAGAADVARAHRFSLYGGDLSSTSGPFVCSVTAFGDVHGAPLSRRGARVGDRLFVAGPLGASRAGLLRLLAGERHHPLVRAHLVRDDVDLALGARLVGRAHACMDLSDGLAADLPRMCRASGVGAVVDGIARAVAPALGGGRDAIEHALVGGEDYHLLFALAPDDDGRDLPAIEIGRVVDGDAVTVVLDGQARPLTAVVDAFDHFRASRA